MPQIALLTDFGTRDWFVPVMKTVIYSINPRVRIIDISHDILPQNIAEASFVLWNAANQFPAKTIFVTVVDPGVGSARKIIAVETEQHVFISPANGVLDLVLSEKNIKKSVWVENRKYFLDNISSTFHGRDIFAPVAAHISKGVKLRELGEDAAYRAQKSPFCDAAEPGKYRGTVLYIDRFGNLITNLRVKAGIEGYAKVGNRKAKMVSTYSDVQHGQLLAYRGSSGLLEIAVRDGSAQRKLTARYYMTVELKLR